MADNVWSGPGRRWGLVHRDPVDNACSVCECPCQGPPRDSDLCGCECEGCGCRDLAYEESEG